jgi:hypothetical protein
VDTGIEDVVQESSQGVDPGREEEHASPLPHRKRRAGPMLFGPSMISGAVATSLMLRLSTRGPYDPSCPWQLPLRTCSAETSTRPS